MTPPLRISLLGDFCVERGDDLTAQFKTSKAKALLAYLACTQQTHSRHALAGLLWSEDSDERARNSLRVAISHLNKLLPGYIDANRLTITLQADERFWLDTNAFAENIQTIAHAQPELHALQESLALYRGPFLADVAIDDSSAFAEWVTAMREQYAQQVQAVLQQVAQILTKDRDYFSAIPVLQKLIELDPQNEDAHRTLMIAYGRTGQYAAALAQYEQCRQALNDWLNVLPTPTTTSLYKRIREASAETQQEQGGSSESASSSDAAAPLPFVGRTAVLKQLYDLIQTPHARLITITGLGGIGKTRLAQTLLQRLRTESVLYFLNGTAFFPLTDVESEEMLPLALAETLGISLSSKSPAKDQLLDYLANKEMLLVLDTFEHLLDGVSLLQEILSTCGHIKLLVTSREPLQLASEWRVPLQGLLQPALDGAYDARTLGQFDAVDFFVRAAQRVRPDFHVRAENGSQLVRLCSLTGGNPLALQLTALWLRSLALGEIVRHLEQGLDLLETQQPNWPLRQRSMRAILQFTRSLLQPDEQRLFDSLSVFRSSFDEAAAQQVVGADPYLLSALLDVGLLHMQRLPPLPDGASNAATVRYELHDLNRQYAADLMAADKATMLRERHSDFFATLVHGHENALTDRRYLHASSAMALDLANIRAAWQWLLGALHTEEHRSHALPCLARMIPALAYFYDLRALMQPGEELFTDAARQIETAIQTLPADVQEADPALWRQMQRVRAMVQVRVALFQMETSAFDSVLHGADEMLTQLRTLELPRELAYLLTIVGRVQVRRGSIDAGVAHLDEALQLHQQIGDLYQKAYTMRSLGIAYAHQGAYETARDWYYQTLALYQTLGYTPGIAQVYTNIGTTYHRSGDAHNALEHYRNALSIAEKSDSQSTTMVSTGNIGSANRTLGNLDLAHTYVQRSLSMAREIGNQRWVAANLQTLADIFLRQRRLEQAEAAAQDGLSTAHSINSLPDLLGCASVLAHTWTQVGQIEQSLRILYFVEQHPATMARDRFYNHELFQELQAELPTPILEEAMQWADAHSVDELVTWLNTGQPGR